MTSPVGTWTTSATSGGLSPHQTSSAPECFWCSRPDPRSLTRDPIIDRCLAGINIFRRASSTLPLCLAPEGSIRDTKSMRKDKRHLMLFEPAPLSASTLRRSLMRKRNIGKILRSSAWRQTRARILARDPMCTACRRRRSTQVHHILYGPVGYIVIALDRLSQQKLGH